MKMGADLAGYVPPAAPNGADLIGNFAHLTRMQAQFAPELHRAFAGHDALWDFMAYGPFASASAYQDWAEATALGDDPLFFAIRDKATGQLGGVASYLNIVPAQGRLEIGHICLGPEIAGTRVASEALAQMIAWAFNAGYRRVEWKCDARNTPSRRAAQRLGFAFEGVFRNHMIIKGRNRNTAWFAITDDDWPQLSAAHQAWLGAGNFDAAGTQRQRLSDMTRPLLQNCDPALSV
jgi:RimJ/RimL family protein N-acetyltransferase